MFNQNLFNQNYINEGYYNMLLKQKNQIEQQIQFEKEQEKEIINMLKALDDFFDASQKIAPQHQEEARTLCVEKIFERCFMK